MKHKNDVMNSYLNSFVTWLSGSYSWLTCHILLPVQLPGFTLTVVQRNDIDLPDMELKGNVLVYSITGCPHCMKAKNTLQENNIPYTDINLDTFPQCREDVKTRTGRSTVPQIFFNATHVGGNDDLVNLTKDKASFEALIKEVQENESPPEAPQPPDPSTAVEDSDLSGFTCELDEYAQLVKDLRKSGLIKDHRQGLLTVHKNSFSGKEFVDWVVNSKKLDRSVAIEMGQALIDKHFGHNVKSVETFQDTNVYYKLLDDIQTEALNSGMMSDCEPRPAGEVGEDIRKLILKIYNVFLSKDGRQVNYKGISTSSDFDVYKTKTKELQRVQVTTASREEKLAFFINIYNALVIHGNVVLGPPKGLWQRYKFFNTVKYIIGGHSYSLQDIENGVLRSNRKGVGMFTRPFSKSDPRFKVALETHEPLIHFALVCGAKSCPPIKTYSVDGIYEQLKLAAEAFLEGDDGITIDMKKKHIKLSKILGWYQEDFGKNKDEVLHWILNHMPEGSKKSNLSELVSDKSYKLSYLEYNWGTND